MPELAHAPPPATDLDAPCLEAGCKLGDYRIVARLSSGGMATLYLARRGGAAGFSRFVAIKVVHPHLAQDTQFVRMFVDEAKLSSRIQHPNVVHVEELGEAEGTYYLVMEYVHGFSLAQVLAALARHKRRLSPALAVWIAMRVADGLHQAHETKDARGQHLGVVHRDVSPQNILLSTHGHIKLIDFGIAKAFGRQYQTVTGSLKGKLKYMAPEQARASAVDRRTDIYALGIVLWEMLAMRRLFKAENDFDLLEKVRDPEISSPRLFAAHDISDALERAVLSALAKDPAARPQSALHFMRA
ncbi:MAG: serine/threonine-protein kinase, partial [Polyangiales bacterium]